MISQNNLYFQSLTESWNYPRTIDDFLENFRLFKNSNIARDVNFISDMNLNMYSGKFCPIITLATPKDATSIVTICNDAYCQSYPYKELLDAGTIEKLIKLPSCHFLLFKTIDGTNIGCFKCLLKFEEKKAYIGSFMIKKSFQGKVDVILAIKLSLYWMWNTFKDKIDLFYCENRAAHTISQYMTELCGIKTVGLMPNKDKFFNQVESDTLGVIYSRKAIRLLRSQKSPKIIKEAIRFFSHVNKFFNLGSFTLVEPEIILDASKITKLRNLIGISKERKKHGYNTIKIKIKNTRSFMRFSHISHLSLIENLTYKIDNLEELKVLINHLMQYIEDNKIRYAEAYVSAYKSNHQELFLELGTIKGYIPCWKFNKESNCFEDHMLFSYFEGPILNLNLLPESKELLEIVKFQSEEKTEK